MSVTITLSFRSTEYRQVADGGDFVRDAQGADMDIFTAGFAFAQIQDMEAYYADLKASGKLPAGATLNVTGYSLGSHLATVFTELHTAEINQTTLFNGAGRGDFNTSQYTLQQIQDGFWAAVSDPASHQLDGVDVMPIPGASDNSLSAIYTRAVNAAGTALPTENIYADPRYQWALQWTKATYGITTPSSPGVEGLASDAAAKITQLYGHGTHNDVENVANSGVHASDPVALFIEDQPEVEGFIGALPALPPAINALLQALGGDFGNTHSLALLADSLALMNVLEPLGGMGANDLGALFAAAANERAVMHAEMNTDNVAESHSLENVLDAMRKLVFGPDVALTDANTQAGGFGDFSKREIFYQNLDDLQIELAKHLGLTIQSLIDTDQFQANGEPIGTAHPYAAADIINSAKGTDGLAWRYALQALNPFVVRGNDVIYAPFNQDSELELFDAATGKGLTDQWLEDRAALLEHKLYYNIHDASYSKQDGNGTLYDNEGIFWQDVAAGLTIERGAGNESQFIRFGADGEDVLVGNAKDDHLYGGANNDYLDGKAGNDYLEGGEGNDILIGGTGNNILMGGLGNDVYYVTTGAGNSNKIIETRETDGKIHGELFINGNFNGNLDQTHFATSGLWIKDPNRTNTWVFAGDSNMILTHNSPWRIVTDDGSEIELGDYQDGDFGIFTSDETPQSITTDRTILGDLAPIDFDPATEGIQEQYDDLGNIITDPNAPAPARADTLYDSTGNDRIVAGGGDDLIYATRGGDDVIQAGGGRDYVEGRAGNDQIEGGADGDIISGGEGNDTIYADAKLDLTTALENGRTRTGTGLKGDWLAGGAGRDILIGSDSNDVLTGGAGEDVLIGGAGDDDIAGDSEWVAASFAWTVTGNGANRLFQPVVGEAIPPGVGADVIYAGNGNDHAWGGGGNDVISGEDGDDTISGNGGNDILLGGVGNDVLEGDGIELAGMTETDPGDDWMDGGDGDDTLNGGIGNDTLYGGNGADILQGEEGDDILAGEQGDDQLAGGVGNDTLSGGDGHDILWGDNGDGTPVDYGNDMIDGGAGNDQINAGEGDDTIDGGTDHDNVVGGAGNDTIAGGDGDDILWGDDGQIASNLSGNDTIDGGAGDDRLMGEDGGDVLRGGEGKDALWGMIGNDTLEGGTGLDYFEGGAGDDTYIFNSGDGLLDNNQIENLVDAEGSNTLQFGTGIVSYALKLWTAATPGDYMLQYGADDYVYLSGATFASVGQYRFADGTLLNRQELMSRALQTSVNLSSTDAGSEMIGSRSSDTLNASGGGSGFWGGRGNDTLTGSGGNNIYYYNLGDGTDQIIDTSEKTDVNGNPTLNRLVFGSGIAVEDIKLGLGSLRIQVGSDVGDVIYIEGFNPDDALSLHPIDLFQFADGTVLTYAQLLDLGFDIDGTSGNDALVGTSMVDRIDGKEGDDTLSGQAGADIYSFGLGSGNDVIADSDALAGAGDTLSIRPDVNVADISLRRNGDDLVLSIRGATDSITLRDYLVGGANAVETIYFESDGTVWDSAAVNLILTSGNSGNDVLSGSAGNDTLDGGTGEDVLAGNAGDDTLFGGADNDTYLFNAGWGQDVIWEEGDTSGDVIKFGGGISASDIIAVKSGADLMLYHSNGVDQIKISNWYTSASYRISRFEFADGTFWTTTEVHDRGLVTLTGTNGDNSISGTSASETIYGLGGSDVLNGGSGDDVLIGGKGNDTLLGSTGSNTYIFAEGDGADSISGSTNDTLRFATGIGSTDIEAAREGENLVLRHINGTDSVTILGWYSPSANRIGNVIFDQDGTVWPTSELTVMATDIAHNYAFDLGMGAKTIEDWGGLDSLVFGGGIADADIVITRVGQDLNLGHINGNDSLTVKDWFNEVSKQIEAVQFLDSGNTLTPAQLTTPFLTLTGTSANDSLQGGNAYGESLYGLAGNDTILGGGGDDQITGGAGNDYLDGGVGADTYYFNQGDGQDIIAESNQSYSNTLIFGSGLLSTLAVSGGGSGQDTTYSFGDGTDSVTVKAGASVNVKFESYGTSSAEAINGSSYGDVIHGLAGADTLSGNNGADILYGDADNDTLIGGSSSDYLYGGDGDDILDGNIITGSGDAETYGSDATDYLYGGKGNDTLYGNSNTDMYYFNLGDGNDVITEGYYSINGYWYSSSADQIVFGAGIAADDLSYSQSGNDLFVRVSETDSVTIKNWFIDSKAWVDFFAFADGSVINASTITKEALTVHGISGNDVITGHASFADSLYGEAGDDALNGQGGNDSLQGGTGNDTLYGQSGNDVLNGGTGNDLLYGGSDDDSYYFSRGDGQDVVSDSGGSDKIFFDASVTAGEVLTSRIANDLVLGISNTDDSITIKNYFGKSDYVFNFGGTSYRLSGYATAIESFNFSDGSSVGNLPYLFSIRGEETDDNLSSTAFADVMYGNGGNDTLYGLDDEDTLYGNEGDDKLYGGNGNDNLSGDNGNDFLAGGDGADLLVGGFGNDYLKGDQSSDYLVGGYGSDSYFYSIGDGWDDIYDFGYSNTLETDKLIFEQGIEISDLTYYRSSNNLQIYVGSTYITVKNQYTNSSYGIERLQFADGSSIGLSDIQNADTASVINGTGADSILTGSSGADTLNGNEGNDWLSGGLGGDKLIGGKGDDRYLVDNSKDVVTELAGEGLDTIYTSISFTTSANVENMVLVGSAAITATDNMLDNYLKGNSANNTLSGSGGNDILMAGDGADALKDSAGNNLFHAGSGADTVTGATGNEFFIGGTGNDTITTGTGYDVIGFNKGDGQDIVTASTGSDNTISLGGGISYSDLSLSRSGRNLVLTIGASDQITFKDWYAKSTNSSVLNLQVIAEAMADFSLGGSDPLRNDNIETFDFAGLVSQFDTEGAPMNWQLTDARLTAHLGEGSDIAALGGDLAYQYGMNGGLTGLGLLAAQNVISSTSFGQSAQTLNSPSIWQAETVRLA